MTRINKEPKPVQEVKPLPVEEMKHLKTSEANLHSVILAAPACMALFMGREFIVHVPNHTFIDLIGKGPDIEGKPLSEIITEPEGQEFLQILNEVFASGQMYQSFKTHFDVIRQGIKTQKYFNITLTPLLNSEEKVYAILSISIDVTDQVIIQQEIEANPLKLLSLFEQSQVAIAIISEPDLTFSMVNPFYSKLVGRKPDEIIGKPLLEAIPEFRGQGFDALIKKVIATGIPFSSKEVAVDTIRNNQLETIYIDLTYQPQRKINDHISGVLIVATDVTQQVTARQKIHETECTLREAVELAELGTWQIDLLTGILDGSERLKDWFGIEKQEVITIERAFKPVKKSDLPKIRNAVKQAVAGVADGIFDIEFTVSNTYTSKERILHLQGKTFFNQDGKAIRISGLVQDVTHQRKVRLALEHQVQQRTEELKTANQELTATNVELDKSNKLLEISNQNLQQFAYIASHDLQEPLRKIKSFGDLLKMRHSGELGESLNFIKRMQTAATRMSVLIEDLLMFSRISKQQNDSHPVKLNEVIKTVLNDLDLTIQERGAKISVVPLPVVMGDKSQLNHLFLNLLSNALKFRRENIPSQISISFHTVASADLPPDLHPGRAAKSYHRIEVSDNGIGFNPKYKDRIFQVFQRLHGKNEFAGTGIGLAICEKVVINHGGAITAVSQENNGATFIIYLPAEP